MNARAGAAKPPPARREFTNTNPKKGQHMAQETNIAAEPRSVHGSSAARRLRRSGLVPAVLATTKGETELLQLDAHDFEREVARHANPQFIAHLSLGGSVRTALVRELQRNGITGRITHADFGEVGTSYGCGLRLDLPGFPIRLDYAHVIDKPDEYAEKRRFVFWVGVDN